MTMLVLELSVEDASELVRAIRVAPPSTSVLRLQRVLAVLEEQLARCGHEDGRGVRGEGRGSEEEEEGPGGDHHHMHHPTAFHHQQDHPYPHVTPATSNGTGTSTSSSGNGTADDGSSHSQHVMPDRDGAGSVTHSAPSSRPTSARSFAYDHGHGREERSASEAGLGPPPQGHDPRGWPKAEYDEGHGRYSLPSASVNGYLPPLAPHPQTQPHLYAYHPSSQANDPYWTQTFQHAHPHGPYHSHPHHHHYPHAAPSGLVTSPDAYPQLAPAAPPPVPPSALAQAGQGAHRRQCANCFTFDASAWRRSHLTPGQTLCNRCGLYERTHRAPRPYGYTGRTKRTAVSSANASAPYAPLPLPLPPPPTAATAAAAGPGIAAVTAVSHPAAPVARPPSRASTVSALSAGSEPAHKRRRESDGDERDSVSVDSGSAASGKRPHQAWAVKTEAGAEAEAELDELDELAD